MRQRFHYFGVLVIVILLAFAAAPIHADVISPPSFELTQPVDTDGDGLPDGFEIAFGFNPNDTSDASQDADGDGLTNLQEGSLGTNPLIPDTDGDGTPDGEEVSRGFDPLSPPPGVLNENCTVSVLNRTARVNPDGDWILPNVPATLDQVGAGVTCGPSFCVSTPTVVESQIRVRVTCVEGGVTRSGQSEFFTLPVNGAVHVHSGIGPVGISFEEVDLIPGSIAVTAPTTTLTSVGQSVPLSVVATLPDGTTNDVTAAGSGTNYTISNPNIATVSPDGLVTGVFSGTVLVSAMNEGALGLIRLQVVLSGDSDGDGIPDDIELALGLDPNNPVDALEDPDRDGLANRDELNLGTDINNPDTDGDGITDGEEVNGGADGFVTDPLLVDTDGDGIRDALEIATGSDPTDPASLNLAQALASLEVTPDAFVLTFNTIIGEASRQLAVTGNLTDGTIIDLTSTTKGSNYTSSDLTICNFGVSDGRVFAGSDGACTVTVNNAGFSDTSSVTVQTFAPTPLSFVDIPGFANNVDVSGDFAYVAAGSTGLQVVDVSDRAAPVIVASEDTPGNANDVKVMGNTAFIADGSSGLQIFDITDPFNPVIIGTVDTPGDAQDVVVKGDLAFVADGLTGLQVIDISNLALSEIIGSVDTPGTASGVDVDTSIAVVADRGTGIQVVDVSDPANPAIVGTRDTGDAFDVVLEANGDFAFVAEGSSNSLTSVGISDPTNPTTIDTSDRTLAGLLRDVALSGPFAFGADIFFVNGVPIVDVSDPGNMVPRAILDFSSFRDDNGTGIAVDSSFVYLTAARGTSTRLYIGQYLLIEDNEGIAPTVRITAPIAGDTVIEGTTLPVTVAATDDVAVAVVDFVVDGEVIFTDTTVPYQFNFPVPVGITSLTLGAEAVDFGSNIGVGPDIQVNVIPDPLTTVIGRVVDLDGNPVAGATVTTLNNLSSTSGLDGTFSISDVPDILGDIRVNARGTVGGELLIGRSPLVPPAPGGSTDVGDIILMFAQFQRISAGVYHSCVVFSDGTVKCWGGNERGQLGNGTVTGPETCGGFSLPCSTTPMMVPGISTAVSIAAGSFHTCALLSDGTVQCWGNNSRGELGIGTNTGPDTCLGNPCSTTPVAVPEISTAVGVAAGGGHTCVLLSDGRVRCWGDNIFGNLGIGTNTGPDTCLGTPCSTTPVEVPRISTAVSIAVGDIHTCALLADGTVQCWGGNRSGELGIGTTGPENCSVLNDCSATPMMVPGISTAVAIAAGSIHTCALLSDGTVQCWGSNGYGELGIGTTSTALSLIPVEVLRISTAVAIAAGNQYSCALLADGTVQCWGGNRFGQLGIGTNTGPETCLFGACSTSPVTLPGISTAVAVALGSFHTCALLADGTVQCWGENDRGRLGNGTPLDSAFTPIPVVFLDPDGDGLSDKEEVALGTDPLNADTDGDGLSDGREVALGTDPLNADTDGDGLSDGEEEALGTDPLDADTDGDGLTDEAEVLAGDDPLVPEAILPTVAIIAPIDGTTFVEGQTLTVAVDATDNVAVTQVEISVDGALFVTDPTAPYALTFTVPVGANNLTFSASAGDIAGNVGAGADVAVSVIPDPLTTVQGMVIDSDGSPVAGAEVVIDFMGLNAEFFNFDIPLSTLPDLTGLTPDFTTLVSAINLRNPDQLFGNDPFAVGLAPDYAGQFAGLIRITTAGPYTFILGADEGARLTVDGVTVVDMPTGTGEFEEGAGTVTLSPGLIPIEVTYYESIGDAELQLSYIPPGGAWQVVPPSVLMPEPQPFSATTEASGTFSLTDVPTHLGDIVVRASITVNGLLLAGNSPSVAPVRGGTTDVGDIVVRPPLQISAGTFHTCAVLSDGTVQCWGGNSVGQLGIGTTSTSLIPVAVSGLSTAVAVSAGTAYTCALLSDGAVQCWGRNDSGQLGNGITTNSLIPVAVSGLSTAVAIAAGAAYACALLADGTAQCWGENDRGQLGIGTTSTSLIPVAVSGLSTAVAIAVGVSHTCAVLADGTVQCWGKNSSGQLGIGTTSTSLIPVAVTGLSTAVAIAAGAAYACALFSDGTVQCWGDNSRGQLGDGTTTNASIPVEVTGISTAVAIAAGFGYHCALLADSTVQCWGENDFGQLGNGIFTGPQTCAFSRFFCSTTPVGVNGISTAVAIASGPVADHTCAVLADGTVQCWGKNSSGQLGNGTNTGPETCRFSNFCSTTPVAVFGF